MGDQGGHEGPQTADSAQPAPAARPPSLVATDDDVVQAAAKGDARATDEPERAANMADCDIPHKKRKTRRGKSKRRFPYYYKNGRKTGKMVKPEAPHNSNQFLLEDHGDMQFLQEPLSHNVGRTRDSSFSMDSDNEFYSSPDDEERYLIQDFFDQYESLQEERLQAMTKDELIQEHLMLEHKMEQLNKLLKNKQRLAELKPPSPAQLPPPPPSASPPSSNSTVGGGQLQREVERLTMENEALKRENAVLRSNSNSRRSCSSNSNSSSSEDSETDSDDSCSSSTTSSDSVCSMPQHDDPPAPAATIDYSQTNGHHTTNGVETA